MENIAGKVALVTGGNRGIGRAIALALARAGVDVAVDYREREAEAQEVCRRIVGLGRRSIAVRADVSLSGDVTRLVRTVSAELGTITILVNNAAISRPQPMEQVTEQDWDEIIAVNLKSVFLVTQAVLPGMRAQGWGRIINLSSTAAHTGGVVGPHYTASKAGIIGLTHYYAARLAKEGITVNTIAPALIVTEMLTHNPNVHPDILAVKRFGEVDEVDEVALMLAGNGYITGQTVSVNGGWYMT
jgi:3-oxoacyl-[acyl-carrier protein] reductase